jgi:alpha-D-xyloside xylohydrolase
MQARLTRGFALHLCNRFLNLMQNTRLHCSRPLKISGLLLITAFILLLSCGKSATYSLLRNGIVVQYKPTGEVRTQTVRLQAINDRVIRVSASPEGSFPDRESLSVVPQQDFVNWKVEEDKSSVTLSTAKIKARLSLYTGEVVFTDSAGRVWLQEKTGGGKAFKPATADGEKFYEISQVFESPADEAFYGLGQHQEGLMNYKGKDVSLFQYNTKVAVPFLVSNKNYGILWDNYSLSRFGDNRAYRQLNELVLVAKDGKSRGLSGTYSSRSNPSKTYRTSIDSVLNYQYLEDQKRLPKEVPLADARITWEGSLASDITGIHKFFLYYAGYIKVWINGELKADHWRQAWNPGSVKFELDAEAGKHYPVKIEWLPDGGESYLSLTWQQNNPEEQNRLALHSEAADQIDYYFIGGKNLDEVIAGYRTLTGKAEIIPKWALGFWQSRERYRTQAELLGVVSEFRKRQIPIDNIVLDWSYWEEDKWGSQDFDLARFPDATGMIRELHDTHHTNFMISVWPKFYEGIDAYNEFDRNGWLYKESITRKQRDWIGKGYVGTFYDAFNSDARAAFWKLIQTKLYVKGVDAWWLDSTEPDILSNASIADRKKFMNPTALGSSTRYFNAYALMNARGVYEGLRAADPDKRVFIFTRSAYAGSQRYAAATWSGDIAANWQDFRSQIPAGLNFSLSGIPYWTTDIGGFSVERKNETATGEDLENWRELNTRWFQFGAFNPLHRVHGQYPFREVFNIAPEDHAAYKTIVYYNKLRYRLMPYIYSLAGKTYFDDYTIMRALVMDFPSDKNVLNMGNEFMFGPSVLVAPVTTYKARTWDVYLPVSEGGWYDFHTGDFYPGGAHIKADAPLENMPVFVKAGAIVPAGPEVQYTAQKKADPLTLYVYAGANGYFELYEDEELTYGYQQGRYTRISFTYNDATGDLVIGERTGSFPGALSERTFQIVWVNKDRPVGIGLTAVPDQVVQYKGKPITINKNKNLLTHN